MCCWRSCSWASSCTCTSCSAARRRNTAAGKLWAASMCGVGIGSMTFHSSAGRWRQWGRRVDYW